MKLEVGMYCYNKTNRRLGIGKIVTEPDEYNNLIVKYKVIIENVSIGNIVAKFNIIDLIETGDYVNGQVVTQIIPNNRKIDPSTMIYTGTNHVVGLYNEDIEDVMTKEQFEQMKYRIGE